MTSFLVHTNFPEIFEDKLAGFSKSEREKKSDDLSKIIALKLMFEPIQGDFDLKHYAEIHKRLFEDVSSYAGSVRAHDLVKGDTFFATELGIYYLFEKELPKKLKELESNRDNPFAFKLNTAELHTIIDEAHPFREGNGRSARMFINQCINKFGYKLDYSKVNQKEWVEASKQAIKDPPNEELKYQLFDCFVVQVEK